MYTEIVKRLFSNVCTPGNFPQPGKESVTLDWVLENTNLPYEAEEQAGLNLMIALCGWPFGVRLLLANEKTLKYMLERKLQAYDILLKKFELVSTALQTGSGVVDQITLMKLTEFKV